MDSNVILDTALRREEISAIEALMLLQDETSRTRLLEVSGELNERINKNVVTYIRSTKVHYTNVCRAECTFCSFCRKKNQKKTFSLTADEIIKAIREKGPAKQAVLAGGLNPDLNLGHHVQLVRIIREEFPNLHLHGYSPAEIHFLARRARTTPFDVLRKIHGAGLDSLSGDSAEILNDKIRKKICPDKLRTADWVDIIRTAQKMGMGTTATMLFGHIEDEIHICEHLEIIKNIQRETGGIGTFEPVPFVPNGTALARDRKIRSMIALPDVLRIFAISRIFFGRLMPDITVDWTKVGFGNAVQCLNAGANDLGELTVDRHEIRRTDANGKLSLNVQNLRQTMQRAGLKVQQRDPVVQRARPYTRAPREEPVLV